MVARREILIAILFFLVGASVTYFYSKTQISKQVNKIQVPTVVNQEKKFPNPNLYSLRTYSNARYGFSIVYPTSWPDGQQSVNGDGISLYNDKPNNEILVYGTNTPSTFSTQDDPVERENVILNDGRTATTLKLTDSSGKINYIMFFNQSNKQYVFYATVTKDFFDNNQQILLNVLKTFKLFK